MKLAIMQPTFNPWLGYFDLIDYVDEFVFLDAVQLARRSWQVRNRLKINNKEYMFSLPIKKEKSRDETILKDTRISFENYDFISKINTLLLKNYKKTKYFNELQDNIYNILSYKTEYLCEYNINFIKEVSKLLDINTFFSKASSLENLEGNKGDLILNICLNKSCKEYISALGSKEYLNKYLEKFKKNNIDIFYQDYNHPPYNQIGENFISQLGILDLLFNEGLEASKQIILKGRHLSIIKAKSFLHEYKIRAKDKDINSLSGRQGRADLTYFVNVNIFNSLNIQENETILDIGCGDLTFFKIIEKNFNNCTLEGILPTSEEIEKVNKEIKFKEYKNKTQISKAFSFKLPFCDNKFDKVVINGVLILLSKEEVDETLNEISRVSKNNATIYIGELPFVDEFKDKSYGNSIIKWLFYGLKNRGFRYFFNSLKTVFISLFSK